MNSGRPIAPESLQLIFEPLIQAPSPNAEPDERSKTSLGLGLFIAREIVRGHGGEIGVESIAATGTVFTIRLPCIIGTA
jgi:signal transduction histidine kinase